MIITKDSHLDHGLTVAQLAYLLQYFADVYAFRIATISLPPDRSLGTVPCGLYGPAMGDPPVADHTVHMGFRGTRTWPSRLLIGAPMRQSWKLTAIMGPHDGFSCVLYTAFGGPATPQEPGDPGCKDVEASRAFWAEHALAAGSE